MKGRRVMFLHYLLNLEETEMLYCFFMAQFNQPVKHDWTETVQQDLADLEITISLLEIKELSHDRFKHMVKEKCRSAALKQLLTAKSNHSKMASLSYKELKTQQYLVNKSCHSGDAKLLFSLRTRMVKVRNNYKNGQADLCCPLCNQSADTQEHLLVCEKIHQSAPEVAYDAIFGDDSEIIRPTLDILKNSLNIREDLLRAAEEEALVADEN